MSAVFLIDGSDYVVNEAGARCLAQHLRGWSNVDETARETWPEGADAYQIQRARQIAQAISQEDEEPVKLGWRDAELLLLAISTEYQISGNAGLEALYDAARRLLERGRAKRPNPG